MNRSSRPMLGVALVAMAGFLVWLFAQMTRTPRSTRLALTLAACAGLVVLIFVVLALLARRDRRRD